VINWQKKHLNCLPTHFLAIIHKKEKAPALPVPSASSTAGKIGWTTWEWQILSAGLGGLIASFAID
jgi:hypothetical protein